MNMIQLNKDTVLNQRGRAPFIEFPALSRFDFIKHGFSTRLGGISSGIYESMNLGFNRGDLDENVYENYHLICRSIGINEKDLVFTDQVHKAVVRKASSADKGKGYIHKRDYSEIDAHITNEAGVPLLAFSADCVPIFLVDPIKRATGLAHSGWKGTVLKIGKQTVQALSKEYNSIPEDLTAVIGPSIGPSCYEVGLETAEEFRKAYTEKECEEIIINKGEKIYIDLWKANYFALSEAGLKPENIIISGLCTMCRQDLFFSHRARGTKRGSMAAFISLTN